MNKFRTLRADEIDCRISQIKENGLTLLLYKDARCDQNILDETVGPMNWQRHHSRENANCTVSIWDESKSIWIEKEDTGTESNTEAQKGLASDSFKRACFNWGIGRELYTAPYIFIPAGKCNIRKNDRGKFVCYDNFSVSEIEYQPDGQREIRLLEIVNEKTGEVCFRWKNGEKRKAPDNAPSFDRPPIKSLKTLMLQAQLVYGDKAKDKFDELLSRAGCTRQTMNENYYDMIIGWIAEDAKKGAA